MATSIEPKPTLLDNVSYKGRMREKKTEALEQGKAGRGKIDFRTANQGRENTDAIHTRKHLAVRWKRR